MTLAQAVSHQVVCHAFKLNQPWLALTPRVLPFFEHGIQWSQRPPDTKSTLPELIITTGRRAAAVGKWMSRLLRSRGHHCQHIQILNPKDKSDQYDLLLVPEHDEYSGDNVISFRGSIHPYTQSWHQKESAADDQFNRYLAILLGDPGVTYWHNGFASEIQHIRHAYPNAPMFFCASPRLPAEYVDSIKRQMQNSDAAWFSPADGTNPYTDLLRSAKKLFVTTDSINMMNECLACAQPKSLLAVGHSHSKRHQRFISHVQPFFNSLTDCLFIPSPPDSIDQVLNHPAFKRIFN